MLFIVKTKVDIDTLKKAAQDLGGYIKFVIDIEKEVMTIGGSRHVEGEQLLLKEGSRQENLWGGGFDLETGEMDFDSMINIRPNQGNPSREVLSEDTRNKIKDIVNTLLK